MTDRPDQPVGDRLPLDVRIQAQRYAMFRLLDADTPHERLREEWSKLETLLDAASSNGAEGAGEVQPFAWTIPGGDQADCNGFIPTKIYREGEFTKALYAAPPQPAPDAMREALIAEFSQFPNRNGAGRHVAIVDWFLARLSAPVPSPDGAEELAKELKSIGITNHRVGGRYWSSVDIDVNLRDRIVCALSPSGAGAAEPVAWRWQHVNDRRVPRPWHYEDAPWKGNEYMQAEPLYAAPPVRGDREASADDIRAQGWTVAVHNDYRLGGQPYTFWLFTKGRENIKGEGRTDAEALNQLRGILSLPIQSPSDKSG